MWKKQLGQHLSGTNLYFNAALLISFFTTAHGLAFTLGGDTPSIADYAIGGLVSGVISASVKYFYTGFARACMARNLLMAVLLILPAIFSSVASGSFASTSMKYIWEVADLQRQSDAEVIDQTAAPARVMAERTAEVSRLWSAYARFSEDEAEREERRGDSCDGANLGASCGDICELRKDQARRAKEMRGKTDDLVRQADEIVASSGRDATQEGIEALYVDARALWRNPSLENLRTEIAGQIAGFSGDGFETKAGTLQCRDAEAVSKLIEIRDILDAPVDTPQPPRLDPVTGTDVARLNMELLTAIGQSALLGPAADRASAREILASPEADQFRHFWFFSLIVEFLCAGLGIARIRQTVPLSPLPPDLQQVNPTAHKRGLKLFMMYQALTIQNAGKTYFVVPVGSTLPELARNAFVFAHDAGLVPQFLGKPVDFREYGEPSEAQRFHDAAGTYIGQFYLVRWPQRLERRLARTIGYCDAPGQRSRQALDGEILPPSGSIDGRA